MILTNASLLFLQIIFYKNCIFTKKYFLHNYAYWELFLDYIDLLYHFGMLKMSTLCTFQCFFTKAHKISAIQTNVSVLFFRTGLILHTHTILVKRGLCSTKYIDEMLQNVLYFIKYNFFHFLQFTFSLMNALIYVDINQGIHS